MENETMLPPEPDGTPADAAVSADPSTAGMPEDTVLAEHRRALAHMRAATAVDLLIEASLPRDADVIRRLLDIDCAALALTEDADGVPDTRAVREKLVQLRRDCGYLFRQGGSTVGTTPAISCERVREDTESVIRVTRAEEDPDRMSDEDYYRTYFRP